MKFIIAPNAFKGSLGAYEVANAIEAGVRTKFKTEKLVKLPIADGGDGTMEVLVKALGGEKRSFIVQDPFGRQIEACLGLIDRRTTAVIELAEASGVHRVAANELDPFKASTFGTGQLILEAIKLGVKRVVLSLGGSATVDGGIGILEALGFQVLDANEKVTRDLNAVRSIQPPSDHMIKALYKCSLVVLCDVINPLLGEEGAVVMYAPQKGASAEDLPVLERGMRNFHDVILKQYEVDINASEGAGAAGGCGASLPFFLRAKMLKGIDYVMDVLNLEHHLKEGGVFITGEGSVDDQTVYGKGPHVVAKLAKKYGCQTIVLAGHVDSSLMSNKIAAFDAVFSIQPGPISLDTAMKDCYNNIKRTTAQICSIL